PHATTSILFQSHRHHRDLHSFPTRRSSDLVLVGCIDVATHDVEKPDDVAETIRAAMKYVSPDRLFPCTNCGMVPLPREVAHGKLLALGAGARLVRRELEAGA